jgi:hypothetical protein
MTIPAGPKTCADRQSNTPSGRVFREILADGLCLLEYAGEEGIVVEAGLAQRLIAAAQRGDAAWADDSAGALFNDITKLGHCFIR